MFVQEAFDQAHALFVEGNAHFEARRFDEAQACFAASLRALPGRASTRINLAATRLALGRPADALADLQALLADEPQHADAWSHLATAFEQLRRFDEARPALERLLALRPDHAEGWFRLGQTLQRLGRPDAALNCLDRVVSLVPTHAAAWSQRGSLLGALHRKADAVSAFEHAIALGADAALHRFLIAALDGRGAPPNAPRAYVQGLFDDYADGFDAHLVDVLGYRGHRQLVAPLATLQPGGFDAALDLGCGTGLCGPLLKAAVRPLARRLEGVDLSAQMLQRAAALGVYDALHCADVAEHLARCDARFDLLLAADVFIYVGELAAVFAGAARVLRPGGLLCFTVEPADDAQTVQLGPQMRYAHSLPYLQGLAAQHGLQWLQALRLPIREQQAQSIAGLYVYLRRP